MRRIEFNVYLIYVKEKSHIRVLGFFASLLRRPLAMTRI